MCIEEKKNKTRLHHRSQSSRINYSFNDDRNDFDNDFDNIFRDDSGNLNEEDEGSAYITGSEGELEEERDGVITDDISVEVIQKLFRSQSGRAKFPNLFQRKAKSNDRKNVFKVQKEINS